jgi:hypothetical protein
VAAPVNVPRLFERHHQGRQAEAALEVIRPILDQYEKSVLDAAKERYRAGHRDAQDALLVFAQLVALGDLRESLEHAAKRGNRAMERMIETT